MLRLAQAASSEYFSEYGTPPNQRRTGVTKQKPGGNMDGELNIVPFYGGWQYVFRAKNQKVAERIAWLMEGAVANGSYIGYGQGSLATDGGKYHREGVFDALFKMTDPDTRKIKTLANCDCSSLVGACVYGCGKLEPKLYDPNLRTMWTGSERDIIMKTGAFVELTDPLLLELGTGLRRGDILLKTGHTAVAIDNDDHHDTYPIIIYNCAYSRIRKGPGMEYDTIATVGAGAILNAEGKAIDGDGDIWYRVIYGGQTGYTSALYADPLPEARCTGDTWLRKEPGTKGAQIIVIPAGATVYLTGEKKMALSGVIPRVWYGCVYGGHRGWASSLNIK